MFPLGLPQQARLSALPSFLGRLQLGEKGYKLKVQLAMTLPRVLGWEAPSDQMLLLFKLSVNHRFACPRSALGRHVIDIASQAPRHLWVSPTHCAMAFSLAVVLKVYNSKQKIARWACAALQQILRGVC